MAELRQVVHVFGTTGATRGEAARGTGSPWTFLLRMGGMPKGRARIQCEVMYRIVHIVLFLVFFLFFFLFLTLTFWCGAYFRFWLFFLWCISILSKWNYQFIFLSTNILWVNFHARLCLAICICVGLSSFLYVVYIGTNWTDFSMF